VSATLPDCLLPIRVRPRDHREKIDRTAPHAGMAHPATRVTVEEYAVEHAFRSLKTVDLQLRPVFHWTSRGRFGGISSRFLAKFPSFWRNSSS
jgi:hypothetical protein